ncbi:MAG: 3-oxoacyl-ACP synthase [Crocinitomicaceae bacterium TMED114]|nr:MAG: 3-oxoacyl-ACP synthase [Crocinitomicaceae bacterium TMED114]
MNAKRDVVVQTVADALTASMDRARTELDTLRASLTKETKSTAGDKHETGRAMVQLEIEQAGQRFSRFEAMSLVFGRLNPEQPRKEVGPGAWVECGVGNFFIGVSLGALQLPDGTKFHAISSDAPLAVALRGAVAGSTAKFRGAQCEVVRVG